jgi:hypothetical protein
VARSLTETLDEAAQAAVQASDSERDREAWNLPRAPGGTIASWADKDENKSGERDPGEQGPDLPASPKTTE